MRYHEPMTAHAITQTSCSGRFVMQGHFRTVALRLDRTMNEPFERHHALYTDYLKTRIALHQQFRELELNHPQHDPLVHRPSSIRSSDPRIGPYLELPRFLRLSIARGAYQLLWRERGNLERLGAGRSYPWFYLVDRQWRFTKRGLVVSLFDGVTPVRFDDPRADAVLDQVIRTTAMVYRQRDRWYLQLTCPYEPDWNTDYIPRQIAGYALHQDGLLIRSDGKVYEPGWVRQKRQRYAARGARAFRDRAYRQLIKATNHLIAARAARDALRDGLVCVIYVPINFLFSGRRTHPYGAIATATKAGLAPWPLKRLLWRFETRLNQQGVIATETEPFFYPRQLKRARQTDHIKQLRAQIRNEHPIAVCSCGTPWQLPDWLFQTRCPGCKRAFDPVVRRAFECALVEQTPTLDPAYSDGAMGGLLYEFYREDLTAPKLPVLWRLDPAPPFRAVLKETRL